MCEIPWVGAVVFLEETGESGQSVWETVRNDPEHTQAGTLRCSAGVPELHPNHGGSSWRRLVDVIFLFGLVHEAKLFHRLLYQGGGSTGGLRWASAQLGLRRCAS